ncbi:MAG: YaeQ family protein [Vicinamibacterales bacterium]
MALTSTVYSFNIDLSDSDRGVYETLDLKVARHPSESVEFLIARLLAYCLEYTEGIDFSRGLSDPDEPPLAVHDLTGTMRAWIDIGTPSGDRLHKAAKSSPRVAVYNHKESQQWMAGLSSAKIYRAADIEFYALDRSLVGALVAILDRRMSFAMSVSDQEIYLSLANASLQGTVTRLRI